MHVIQTKYEENGVTKQATKLFGRAQNWGTRVKGKNTTFLELKSKEKHYSSFIVHVGSFDRMELFNSIGDNKLLIKM